MPMLSQKCIKIIILCSVFTKICYGQQDSNSSSAFENYLQSFSLLQLPYSIDSVTLYKLNQQEDILQSLTNTEQKFLNIPDFDYYCNSLPRYIIYKFGQLDVQSDNIQYLMYYISKRKDCSYDINECYIVIGKYNNERLIKHQIIGRLFEIFGESIYQYSSINFAKDKLFIQEQFIQEQLDDINPDISHITKTSRIYEW
jgi:hypothetical protein